MTIYVNFPTEKRHCSAKAAAALLANGGNIMDCLEVVGAGRALQRPSLACIAVPTTAGTGAKVTRKRRSGIPPAPDQGEYGQALFSHGGKMRARALFLRRQGL